MSLTTFAAVSVRRLAALLVLCVLAVLGLLALETPGSAGSDQGRGITWNKSTSGVHAKGITWNKPVGPDRGITWN
jgi:hypothetical protein